MIIEVENREEIIDFILNEPHLYTIEDIKWSKEYLNMDFDDCRNLFISADRMFVVFKNDNPIYVFSITDNRLSTASHKSLDGNKIFLTKELLKFSRSPSGRKALKGAMGAVEVTDYENGLVRMNWLKAMNFEPFDIQLVGNQIIEILKFKE